MGQVGNCAVARARDRYRKLRLHLCTQRSELQLRQKKGTAARETRSEMTARDAAPVHQTVGKWVQKSGAVLFPTGSVEKRAKEAVWGLQSCMGAPIIRGPTLATGSQKSCSCGKKRVRGHARVAYPPVSQQTKAPGNCLCAGPTLRYRAIKLPHLLHGVFWARLLLGLLLAQAGSVQESPSSLRPH